MRPKPPRSANGCGGWDAAPVLSIALLHSRLAVAAACVLLVANGLASLEAQPSDSLDSNRAYTVKAAYLLQFARYVEWPADAFAAPESPWVIGVLGPYPFDTVFEDVARTKRIEGRAVTIRRYSSMAQYAPCHILFVAAATEPAQRALALEQLKQSPVLLVGEEPGFVEGGGVVNFFLEEGRVRFEINIQAARQRRLKISSNLLSLAKLVER